MAEIFKTFIAEAKKLDPEAFARVRAERAELEALRNDAERYRWLRSRIPGGTYRIMGVIYSEGGAGVDAAIDAAMVAAPSIGAA